MRSPALERSAYCRELQGPSPLPQSSAYISVLYHCFGLDAVTGRVCGSALGFLDQPEGAAWESESLYRSMLLVSADK